MLDVAIRAGEVDPAHLTRREVPSLPVGPALHSLLPDGLRRGSIVSVSGSTSLLLALLGAPSAQGAWCALVGDWSISAEAAAEYGVELSRLAIVPAPDAKWSTAVGALLDAVDVVVAQVPNQVTNGDIRRLAARARSHDAVFIPFLTGDTTWPGAEVRLSAQDGNWMGIGAGHGRLRQRRLTVAIRGRGSAARPRSALLWLPAAGGGVQEVDPEGTVVTLPMARAG